MTKPRYFRKASDFSTFDAAFNEARAAHGGLIIVCGPAEMTAGYGYILLSCEEFEQNYQSNITSFAKVRALNAESLIEVVGSAMRIAEGIDVSCSNMKLKRCVEVIV